MGNLIKKNPKLVSIQTTPTKEAEDRGQQPPTTDTEVYRKQSSTEDKSPVQEINLPPIVEPELPDHTVLQNDDNLNARLKELISRPEVLTNEFNLLREYVREHIKKEVTVARLPENEIHNRYTDNRKDKIIIF